MLKTGEKGLPSLHEDALELKVCSGDATTPPNLEKSKASGRPAKAVGLLYEERRRFSALESLLTFRSDCILLAKLASKLLILPLGEADDLKNFSILLL